MMMAGILSLASNAVAVIVGLLVFLAVALGLRHRRNLPPGPRGWPFLGVLPKLLAVGPGQGARQWLSDLAKKHDIYSLNVGGQLVVVVTQFTTIRAAFVNPHAVARPPSTLSAYLKIFPNPNASGIVMSSGAKWAELRMHVAAILKGDVIGARSLEDIISEEAGELVKDVGQLSGKPFDPKSLLRKHTANIISTVVLGRKFQDSNAEDQKFLDCLHRFSDTDGFGSLLGMMPFVQKLASMRGYGEAKTAVIDVVSFLRHEVKCHQMTVDLKHPRDAIDVFLRGSETARRHNKATLIDTDDIVLTIFDLFLGGTETITSTLRWALLYLANYPDVEREIQAEFDDVVGRDRVPALSDQRHLPLIGATICESQRLGCVVPLVGPHYVSEDTTLFGFNIPKGTIVVGDFWNMSRDRAIWQDSGHPDKFVPDRFLDETGMLDRRDKQLNAFSRGRRLCPGENLARKQLFLLLSNLLHHFHFSLPKGEPPMLFKGDFKMTHAPRPYKIIATPRD